MKHQILQLNVGLNGKHIDSAIFKINRMYFTIANHVKLLNPNNVSKGVSSEGLPIPSVIIPNDTLPLTHKTMKPFHTEGGEKTSDIDFELFW